MGVQKEGNHWQPLRRLFWCSEKLMALIPPQPRQAAPAPLDAIKKSLSAAAGRREADDRWPPLQPMRRKKEPAEDGGGGESFILCM